MVETPESELRKLHIFSEKLYKEMELRKKAIANWKKLRIILAVLRMCKANTLTEERSKLSYSSMRKLEQLEKEKNQFSCNKTLEPFLFDPKGLTILIYNILFLLVYFFSAFQDIFTFAFHGGALLLREYFILDLACSGFFCLSVLLLLFVPFEKEQNHKDFTLLDLGVYHFKSYEHE